MSKNFGPKYLPAKEPLNFMFWDKLRVDHSSSGATSRRRVAPVRGGRDSVLTGVMGSEMLRRPGTAEAFRAFSNLILRRQVTLRSVTACNLRQLGVSLGANRGDAESHAPLTGATGSTTLRRLG